MAGASFFALFDDIALLLDDVAAMSKVAAKKTAGVLGDDLAVNAEQVSGVKPDRELPVVWAVAKGSFINKLFLVPAALLISFFLPWAIMPLLVIGGLFLCFEGAEKLLESNDKSEQAKAQKAEHHQELVQAVQGQEDILAFEQEKIKGAIRTDFVLSAEIIIIALGTIATATLTQQISVLSVIAIGMTVGVYGLVALIVKLDDIGLYWQSLPGTSIGQKLLAKLGGGLLVFAPRLMQSLSFIGLVAMFLVGGGMLTHNIELLHHLSAIVQQFVGQFTTTDSWLITLSSVAVDGVLGIIAGLIVAGLIHLIPTKKSQEVTE